MMPILIGNNVKEMYRRTFSSSGVPSWTPDYKGAGYITIEPWHGKAGDTIELDFVNEGTTAAYVIGTDVHGIYYNPTTDLFLWGESIGSPFTIEYVKGSGHLKLIAKSDITVVEIGAVLSGAEPWNGSITGIYLTNQDGSDNRHYPSIIKQKQQPTTLFLENKLGSHKPDEWSVDYAYTGYVQLRKPWRSSNGVITVSGVRDTTGEMHIFDSALGASGSGRAYLILRGTGTLHTAQFSNVVASVSEEVVTTIPVGATFTITLNISATSDVSFIGSNQWGLKPWIGNIYDIHLTDLDNPSNSRHYPSIIKSPTQPTITTLENILDPTGETDGELIGFGYEELPPPSSSRIGYYNSTSLTYSKDKPTQQQTDKSARSQYMTLYREKKVYDGWTNKMGKHGVLNNFPVDKEWKLKQK